MHQPTDQSVGQRKDVPRQYLDFALVPGQYLDFALVPGQYLDNAMVAGQYKIIACNGL